MTDRPTLAELIDAVRGHLETHVIPAVRADRKLYFQTLVAANVLRIAEREIEHGADHARAELARLDQIEGRTQAEAPSDDRALAAELAGRNAALALAIRNGDYDDRPEAIFEHLQATVIEALQIANPRFLARLLAEKVDPAQDAWAGR